MLIMSSRTYDEMVSHAEEGYPLEVCGILGGIDGVVVAVHRMTNTDNSREHFMMDPAEQFAVARELRANGMTMVAIYHSHPDTPARPSEEDIRLAFTPGVSHVIVSLADRDNPVTVSFKIEEGRVEKEGLLVTGRHDETIDLLRQTEA